MDNDDLIIANRLIWKFTGTVLASVESYLPVRCLVPVERKRTHLPENDEEASDRAPMHFEIFPRVVQYRRSVSVAAGESFGKFLWTEYVWGKISGEF